MEPPENGREVRGPAQVQNAAGPGAQRRGERGGALHPEDHPVGAGRSGAQRGYGHDRPPGADLRGDHRAGDRAEHHPQPDDGACKPADHPRYPERPVCPPAEASLHLLRQQAGGEDPGAGDQLRQLGIGYPVQRDHQHDPGDYQPGVHRGVHVLHERDALDGDHRRASVLHRGDPDHQAAAAESLAEPEQQEQQLQRVPGGIHRRRTGQPAVRPAGSQHRDHEEAGHGVPAGMDAGRPHQQHGLADERDDDADRADVPVHRGRLLDGRGRDGLLRRDPGDGPVCQPVLAADHEPGEYLQLLREQHRVPGADL